MAMINPKMWEYVRCESGRLVNPRKRFALWLAADVVQKVGQERDDDGVLLTQKALGRCALAFSLNGIWEERKLIPQLQSIISKYRVNFEG